MSHGAAVPRSFWETLFLSPGGSVHPGFWVSLENVIVGPVIAILSFVLGAVLFRLGMRMGRSTGRASSSRAARAHRMASCSRA